jgi:phospholipid/cholesterol/gamma-HCH transport system substrate-binding protein
MNSLDASIGTRIKVGLFTILGLLLIGAVTVLVNDKPYWWRSCQLVKISVEDATGLKMKSAVRSMGIEIGYLKSVDLSETHVDLGICITAPVEVLPSTRAFIRGEGFLGDKFVELKPVRYLGGPKSGAIEIRHASYAANFMNRVWDAVLPSAHAEEGVAAAADTTTSVPVVASTPAASATTNQRPATRTGTNGRQIPVGETSQDMQAVVNRVDGLVNEMTQLTSNLRQAINPEELRTTMKQLNKTLENASKTLSPDSGLNQTAQRTLAKLEASIDQLRDMLTRMNKGEGSVGRIMNDPVFADELEKALKSMNKILGRASEFRFVVDIGGQRLRGYDGSRGYFKFYIYPSPDRYYLLGISVDPRGRRSITNIVTEAGGTATSVRTTQVEETGILLTGMVGKLFFDRRLDLSIGALYGDGAVSAAINFGPVKHEADLQLRGDVYSRGQDVPTDGRLTLTARIFEGLYLDGGLESFRKIEGKTAWSYGAGVAFDDEDIKLLFTLIR